MTTSIEILALAVAASFVIVVVYKLFAVFAKNITKIAILSCGVILVVQGVTNLNISLIDLLELVHPFIGREVLALLIR